MSEETQDKDSKEFEATDKRKQQARDDGDVAQSKELNGLLLLLGAMAGMILFDVWFASRAFQAASVFLSDPGSLARDIFEADASAAFSGLQAIMLAFLLPVLMMVVGVLSSLALQRSIVFSAKLITPKFEKVSPFENLKKKYSGKGLTDFAKDAAKMLIAGAIAGAFLTVFAQRYYNSSSISPEGIYGFTYKQILWLLIAFTLFQFVLALIDFPLQRFFHAKKLRMSRDDMKKEHKENEGDPHFKQARKSKAAKISNGEMLKKVEDATLVIVNPEHYAVALKWDRESGRAPVCVGKGVDHLAARIRSVALNHGVPIHRDPPTTRALYRVIEIDQEITPEFYGAVAAAIQFVESLEPRR